MSKSLAASRKVADNLPVSAPVAQGLVQPAGFVERLAQKSFDAPGNSFSKPASLTPLKTADMSAAVAANNAAKARLRTPQLDAEQDLVRWEHLFRKRPTPNNMHSFLDWKINLQNAAQEASIKAASALRVAKESGDGLAIAKATKVLEEANAKAKISRSVG